MIGLERVLLLTIGIGEIALVLVVASPWLGCSYAGHLQRVHPDVSHNWIWRWIQIGVLLAICAVLASCGAPAPSLAQGGGLPTLRRLDWGFPYVDSAVWSPDGRWIAVLAGADSAVNHLEVVSPDGRTRYDLSGWHCGSLVDFAIAWLPDGRLSCLTSNGYLKIGAFPFSSFQSVPVSRPISPQPGSAWTSDGKFLIFSSISDPFVTGPYIMVTPARLYAVSIDGQVLAVESTPELYAGGAEPNWLQLSPSGTELTVVEARTPPSTQDSRTVLIAAALHEERGQLALGQQDVLATGIDVNFSWSPSGRWLAVRHSDYRGGDKIYLVNPQQPSQTVDVVLADKIGQQMMSPIWSPDGKTLIVFSVALGVSYPYAIDIASYLHTKGLQP